MLVELSQCYGMKQNSSKELKFTYWLSEFRFEKLFWEFGSIQFRERLHETQSEVKSVWNLKPLWKVLPFTWDCSQPWDLSNRIQTLFCLHSDFTVDLSAMAMVEWNSFIMSNVADGQCRYTCAVFMFSLSR